MDNVSAADVLEGKEKVTISGPAPYCWDELLLKIIEIETIRPLLIGIDKNLDELIDEVVKGNTNPGTKIVDVTQEIKDFLKDMLEKANIDLHNTHIEIESDMEDGNMDRVLITLPKQEYEKCKKCEDEMFRGYYSINEDLIVCVEAK